MILTVLNSGSTANGYLLSTATETLIIDAGVRLQILKQALGHNLSPVLGCLVTHAHCDHARYAFEYARSGIDIYCSDYTAEIRRLFGHRVHQISHKQTLSLGRFRILPLWVPHDLPNLGFLIKHPACGVILFVTDAAYIPYRFRGLNHILIETNYHDDLLINDRAVGNHMSLDTCLKFLRANDLTNVQNIVLLHLSSTNSDAKMFLQKVSETAPSIPIHIAEKNLQIDITYNRPSILTQVPTP